MVNILCVVKRCGQMRVGCRSSVRDRGSVTNVGDEGARAVGDEGVRAVGDGGVRAVRDEGA
jgi:hypothetical protein